MKITWLPVARSLSSPPEVEASTVAPRCKRSGNSEELKEAPSRTTRPWRMATTAVKLVDFLCLGNFFKVIFAGERRMMRRRRRLAWRFLR